MRSSKGGWAAAKCMGSVTSYCTEQNGMDADSAGSARLQALTLHCSAVPDGNARRFAVLHGNKRAGESEA